MGDYQDKQHSADLQRKVDEEVSKVLKDSYARVQILLKKHETELHTLSRALMEHETLTLADIKRVLEGKPPERAAPTADPRAAGHGPQGARPRKARRARQLIDSRVCISTSNLSPPPPAFRKVWGGKRRSKKKKKKKKKS